jgi:hypothetical protein
MSDTNKPSPDTVTAISMDGLPSASMQISPDLLKAASTAPPPAPKNDNG